MPHSKDVFISYGRKESEALAWRLYQQLDGQGYSAWFDRVNIPTGNDFIQQIEHGIQHAHNFIFIISPHANNSDHCRQEIELALRYGKRMVPLLHIEKDLDKVHPAIGRIHWISARQQYDPRLEIAHWQDLDNFNDACSEIFKLIEKDREHVEQHTAMLLKAVAWQENHHSTMLLLEGEARIKSQQWLLREFPPPLQLPCKPTDLHARYICESRKNAENLLTDVYFCFHSTQRPLFEQLKGQLNRNLITSWEYQHDLRKGQTEAEAVEHAIERAGLFLVLVSEALVQDADCLAELTHAASLNKKIIPVMARPVPESKLPAAIRPLHPVNFTDNATEEDFAEDLQDLLREITESSGYYQQHRNYLVQALKWQRHQQNPGLLLRGFNLQHAVDFLQAGERMPHKPLPLHRQLITESEAKAGQQGTEVFIAYSRRDSDFARRLNEELQISGKTTWFDQESIFAGAANFEEEIEKGIKSADNFLFIISPRSLASPFCQQEIALASENSKRIVTVMLQEPDEALPPQLQKINWIDFRKRDYHRSFTELIRALDVDRAYVQQHTRWGQKAQEWLRGNKNTDLMLRGTENTLAAAWLENALLESKQPPPSALQQEFIRASSREQELEDQRKAQTIKKLRFYLLASVVCLVAALAFGLWTAFTRMQIEKARIEMDRLRVSAENRRLKAEENARLAEEAELELNVLNAKYAQLLEIAESKGLLLSQNGEEEQLVEEILVLQQERDKANLELSEEEPLDPVADESVVITSPQQQMQAEEAIEAPAPQYSKSRQEMAVPEAIMQQAPQESYQQAEEPLKRPKVQDIRKSLLEETDSFFIIALRGDVADASGNLLKRGDKVGDPEGLQLLSEDARVSIGNRTGSFILTPKGGLQRLRKK